MRKDGQELRSGLAFANQYLPWIIATGIALGVANYSLGFWSTLGQSIFQQVAISLIIGYGIFLAIWLCELMDKGSVKQFLILGLLFSSLGIIGSISDRFINNYIFQKGEFSLFGSGGAYLFNVILSNVLGFATYHWSSIKKANSTPTISESLTTPKSVITELPIKQGDVISLHPLKEAMYFESYDNYSFLFNINGERILTNNSLSELERKLGSEFLRVHRKYLINRDLIHQVQPQFKGRYTIYFRDKDKTSIVSGASFADVIRGIIKI